MDFHPSNARLNFPGRNNRRNSWRSVRNDRTSQFIQVDLLTQHNLTKIETQGGQNGWVSDYSVSFSNDGVTFIPYGEVRVVILPLDT